MIRLSCPHLVKEIDQWEHDGAIEELNYLLEKDRGEALRENFRETNKAHSDLRKAATTPEQMQHLIERHGQKRVDFRMQGGIIGVSQNKLDDIKCVHAHVADQLLRGGNLIGEKCLELLEKKGVNVRGCDGCSQQCDPSVKPEDAGWWYRPKKNYEGIKASRAISRARKKLDRELGGEGSLPVKKSDRRRPSSNGQGAHCTEDNSKVPQRAAQEQR
mmetsp:Transcript_107142/g.206077  ORF Transcript_107142/g.206077 Transcript_107142/m.206077 type:complete len:216 (-) Transcript_107142:55-702(-)